MNEYVQPDEAASSLAEVRRRQQHLIDAVMVPAWYWWIVAVAMIARAWRSTPSVRLCSRWSFRSP